VSVVLRTVTWIMQVKFDVRIFNRVEATGVYLQNIGGHVSLATSPFGKFLMVHALNCHWEHACTIFTPVSTKLHYVQMK